MNNNHKCTQWSDYSLVRKCHSCPWLPGGNFLNLCREAWFLSVLCFSLGTCQCNHSPLVTTLLLRNISLFGLCLRAPQPSGEKECLLSPSQIFRPVLMDKSGDSIFSSISLLIKTLMKRPKPTMNWSYYCYRLCAIGFRCCPKTIKNASVSHNEWHVIHYVEHGHCSLFWVYPT